MNLIDRDLALKKALDEQGCNQQTTTYPVNYQCVTIENPDVARILDLIDIVGW